MSRKKAKHYPNLHVWIKLYCEEMLLDYHRFSLYHMRVTDGGYTMLDVWSTGRYYIHNTSYLELGGKGIRERGGEKGMVEVTDKEKLFTWLDGLFFAAR